MSSSACKAVAAHERVTQSCRRCKCACMGQLHMCSPHYRATVLGWYSVTSLAPAGGHAFRARRSMARYRRVLLNAVYHTQGHSARGLQAERPTAPRPRAASRPAHATLFAPPSPSMLHAAVPQLMATLLLKKCTAMIRVAITCCYTHEPELELSTQVHHHHNSQSLLCLRHCV